MNDDKGHSTEIGKPSASSIGNNNFLSEIELVGSIDFTSSTSVRGWIHIPSAPHLRLDLALMEEDVVLSSLTADEYREDLREDGYGDGRYAFHFDLDKLSLAPGRHTLSVIVPKIQVHVPGSPFTIEVEYSKKAKGVRGNIDGLTDTVISGWIFDSANPLRRCSVQLAVAGQILARATASEFRADLRDEGIGDGRHAFLLPMPRALLDGGEYSLDIIEEESGFAFADSPLKWRSGAGKPGGSLFTVSSASAGVDPKLLRSNVAHHDNVSRSAGASAALKTLPTSDLNPGDRSQMHVKDASKTVLMIDISDLVYYIGHHDNLTGIQRVQSNIVLSMARSKAITRFSVSFLSFSPTRRKWMVIPFSYLINLLEDLFYPNELRRIQIPKDDARVGLLPGSVELEKSGVLSKTDQSVLCLLGAAWVQRDYFNRVLLLKRQFQTKFVMLVHDLIPIYARETCDQGTAQVFESFFLRAMRHTDHYLCVSENTANDLRKYLTQSNQNVPPITVTRLGGSLSEFSATSAVGVLQELSNIPDRFVLFVSTIEGRKNHKFMFDIWRRLAESGDEPPVLLCVGRVGWRSQSFLSDLVGSNYLNNRIVILEDISDLQLKELYEKCLFTVFPSVYEGWGLPVGESLAYGKICVCSSRASIPEVAGEFGVYMDIDNLDESVSVVKKLIRDDEWRQELEDNIHHNYKARSWESVAEIVMSCCEDAAKTVWNEPYPFSSVPYSFEVSFSTLDLNIEGVFGNELLARATESRKPSLFFEPLAERNILLGEDIRSVGAWSEPEGWGTWLCESSGELSFTLPADECAYYYVFLRLRVSSPISSTNIRLLFNTTRVWDGVIGEGSRTLVMRIFNNAGTRAPHWRAQIRAEVNLSTELRERIISIDGRVPTIGFERLSVIPEHDTRARMDALTRMLIEQI